MNNIVVPNMQISNGPVNNLPIDSGNIAFGCNGASCDLSNGTPTGDFFELLNKEIAELLTDVNLDSESLDETGDLLDLNALGVDLQGLDLAEDDELTALLGEFDFSIDALKELSKDWPAELQSAFQQALDDLPDSISQLPFTPENMQFVQQQAVMVMAQKDQVLAQQAQNIIGQSLPMEGKILPVQAEQSLDNKFNADFNEFRTVDPKSVVTPLAKHSANTNEPKDTQNLNQIISDDGTNLEADGKTELFKAALTKEGDHLEQKVTTAKLQQDKQSFEHVVAKAQSDAIAQIRSIEPAITQNISNISGVNQASVTTAAVVGNSSMQLPLNPTPEQWGSALGDKVQWMINAKLETAEIRIDPPHLGKMDVRIKMDGDGANIVIHTHQAATRDLVDAASFRLKEMLQDSGYNNVDVDVSHREQGQASNEFAQSDSHSPENNDWGERLTEVDDTEVEGHSIISGVMRGSDQSLDLFA